METSSRALNQHYDDRQYESQVLHLADGRNEDDLDDQYHADAANLGVKLLTQSLDTVEEEEEEEGEPIASCNTSTDASYAPPRSSSVTSNGSWSTGLATNPSRLSRENHVLPIHRLSHRTASSRSLSSSHRSSALSFGLRSPATSSLSSFPTSSNSSVTSLPSPTAPKTLSVVGRLGRFSMFKKPSLSPSNHIPSHPCRLCPPDQSSMRPTHPLHCPHNLCESHLRELVIDVREGRPSQHLVCCKNGIPEVAAQAVMDDRVRRTGLDLSPGAYRPHRPRTSYSTESLSAPVSQTFTQHRRPNTAHNADPRHFEHFRDVQMIQNLQRALEFPDFRSIRKQHQMERDRFLTFRLECQVAIRARWSKTQDALSEKHRHAQARLTASHPSDLAELEEKQLAAEFELREHHALESRNCLLALRHMEGYCKGHDPDGTGRVVTLEDRRKLERQYSIWNSMERRHNSAVNVMREQQARQMKARTLKQMNELSELQLAQNKESQKLVTNPLNAELDELGDIFERRKARLVKRWNVAMDTWKGWRGKDEGFDPACPIAPLEWPDSSSL